ncbi:MAG: IS982 family transposase [Caldilineaceae bacterium]
MQSIPFVELATVVYVLVDEWYQAYGVHLLRGKTGKKPRFSDSEVLTLLLLMDFVPFPGETQFLGFIRANYLSLFPELVDQSQFNRRGRNLRLLLEALRRYWAEALHLTSQQSYLLDTKPVPVVGYKRSKRHSDFSGSATYGYCASRNLHYFGYKLVTLSTLDGEAVVYELVPAHTDERVAAETVLRHVYNCDILCDKGFIGDAWQAVQYDNQGNRIWTPKRTNQHTQNPPGFDQWLNAKRERIEGLFHEVQNTGRNLERLLRKSVIGLATHVIAKMTSHLLKRFLRLRFGFNLQSFSLSLSHAFISH